MGVIWMSKSKRTYEELKNDFKQTILNLESDLLSSSEKIDNQQIVNRIVKKFDEDIAKDLVEEVKDL